MIEIPVHNPAGQQVDTLQLDEALLGGEVRPALLKQAYVRFHANRRQGTSATRSRGMVEGSTRKLYKQKGTGNARRGPLRTNLMKGGGVAFAKKPKSWRLDMPHKMRRLANRNALLAKAVDGEIKVVDSLAIEQPKTSFVAGVLKALGVNRSCLIALPTLNTPVARSAANLADTTMIRVDQLNTFDLLNHRFLVVEKRALLDWVEGAKGRVRDVSEAEVAAGVAAAAKEEVA